MSLTILFVICLGNALASVPNLHKPFYSLEAAEKHFEDFIEKYDRHYANEEEKDMRFEIFKQSLVRINKKNMDPTETAVFGIDHFADLTQDELRRFVGPEIQCTLLSDSHPYIDIFEPVHKCQIQKYVEDMAFDIPENLDWRNKGIVTKVKFQHCGDCWSHGTTGNVESMYAKKHGKLVDLSNQQLIDCDKNNKGCSGGRYNNSFGGLVTIGGMMSLKDYPYLGIDDTCKFDKSKVVAKLKDCIVYDLKDEEQLRLYVATNGPIAISIDATDISDYKGGILSNCGLRGLNHAVLLVGYGTENGTPYWIVKNSWGVIYGEEGYVRLKRNVNACGLINPCAATAIIK